MREALLTAIAVSLLATKPALAQNDVKLADPSQQQVPLPCADDWRARLIFDAGVGVWTVASYQVQPWFGCPEVVALDDRGRCTVLRSYSGKWTPQPTIEDGRWLAPVAFGDLDPSHDGSELYVGGQGGRLWQLSPRRSAHFDCRVVGEWPGEEVHTLVLGDLDPARDGSEMLVFLMSGRVHMVSSAPAGVELRELDRQPGRVRQAIVLESKGRVPWVATVSRVGELALVRVRGTNLERRVVAKEPMGLGRVAMASAGDGRTVLYVTRDDGVILRFAGEPDARFTREIVMVGTQGPRGIVTGRFHEDPRRECLAVFGYSKRVVLLSRLPGQAWESEVIYEDVDKGHWLAVAEVDGRNGTDEIIGSGYSGRVFLLSRHPGYGLANVAVSQAIATRPHATARTGAIRVGLRARRGGVEKLTPLRYTGGFEPKTMLYETLVRRGDDGRLAPGLAESWSFEDEGRSVRFVLRRDATFHDGSAVTARDVREHFRRWIGLREHGWLPSNERIQSVVVESDRVFRVVMDRPWALLPDLAAINPCAIVGPGARDREGEFVRPVGTGPFRFVEQLDDATWLVERFAEHDAGAKRLEVHVFARDGGLEPIDALMRGAIDVFVGGWDEDVPLDRLRELERDPGMRVVTAPGSSVVSLRFRLTDGPMAGIDMRRRIASAVSRAEIIRRAEGGYADSCTTWAAPVVKIWPHDKTSLESLATVDSPPNGGMLRISRGRSERSARVAAIVAEQLTRAGLSAKVIAGSSGDITVDVSHGLPYDPHTTLVNRFASSENAKLRELIAAAASTPSEADRIPIYARIQELMDEGALIVPLYVPRRIAFHTATVEGLRLGSDLYHVDLTKLRRR